MIAVADDADRLDPVRWGICFALIAAVHAGGVWFAAHLQPKFEPQPIDLASVVMIDLEPLPAPKPVPAPPAPPAIQPEPEPEAPPIPEIKPAPAAEVALPPPPRPVRRPQPVVPAVEPLPEVPVERSQAAPAAPTMPAVREAPAPPAAAARAPVSGAAVNNWQGLLLARLEQFKRYPSAARARRQEGAPQVRFAIDRNGRVLSAVLQTSSGIAILDEEAVALVRRADPLPPPPADIPGDPLELVVPVNFSLCEPGIAGRMRCP